jgi:predicted GIY-YIG superfamily endonuclease
MHLRADARPLIAMVSLIANLKTFRAERAAALSIPVFCVFGDTVLNAVAASRPRTPEALMRIRGMSEEKCRQYGKELVLIVSNHKEPRLRAPASKPARQAETYRIGSGHTEARLRAHASKPARQAETSRIDSGHTEARLRAPASKPTRQAETSRIGSGHTEAASSAELCKLSRHPQAAFGEDDVVYILELMHGRVYVGRTKNLQRRLAEHRSGKGSAFTKAYRPTGVMLPRLGRVSGSGEAAERDETLRYMYLRGADSVRGWKYTRVELSRADAADAEANIRELFDLCRRCGHPGHFMSHCRNNYDRAGEAVS